MGHIGRFGQVFSRAGVVARLFRCPRIALRRAPRAFQGCEESTHLILCLHMMLWLDCVEGPDGVCAFT